MLSLLMKRASGWTYRKVGLAFALTSLLFKLARRNPRKHLLVVFQSRAEWFELPVSTLLHEAFPDHSIKYKSNDELYFGEKYDLVVESVHTFQTSDKTPCSTVAGPWIQVIGESSVHYDDDAWCDHTQKPLVRLDTSLRTFAAYSKTGTIFLWSPYACNFKLSHPANYSASMALDDSRPFILSWISSNCVEFRVSFWRALKSSLDQAGLVGGVHSLGSCENNHQLGTTDWWSNYETYKDYRFVLVIENTLEPGYITEKLATVIAAGAIPIYLGDDDAATMLFGRTSFISVRDFLGHGIAEDVEPTHQSAWEDATRKIADLIGNERKLEEYIRSKQEAHTPPPSTYLTAGLFPPSCGAKEHERRISPDLINLQRAIKELRMAIV